MATELGGRIEAMYRNDRRAAWAFVAVLWVVVGFVLLAVWRLVDDPALNAVLAVAAALVLAFNTASILAMVNHYAEDKEFIYGLDLKHYDALEAQRRAARAPMRPAERGT